MNKIILTQKQLNLISEEVLRESYGDKVLDIKKYLDGKYMRGQVLKRENGDCKTIGTFVLLSDKGLPTENSVSFDDVFYKLQNDRKNIFSDKNERDGFFKDVIRAWYDNKINDRGNIVA